MYLGTNQLWGISPPRTSTPSHHLPFLVSVSGTQGCHQALSPPREQAESPRAAPWVDSLVMATMHSDSDHQTPFISYFLPFVLSIATGAT